MDSKIVVFIAFLLISPGFFGLAVGPARVEWIYRPGLEGSFTLTVTENSGKEADIVMYAENGFSENVTISPTNFHLNPFETRYVTYSFKLPESSESYGRNETLIVAREVIDRRARSGQVGAAVAIGHQFWVHIPFPYRFASAAISTENVALDVVKSGNPVFFDVRSTNLGSEDLNVTLFFDVRNAQGRAIGSFPSRNFSLAKGQSKVDEFDWMAENPSQISGGVYTAKATLEFGGDKPFEATQDFKIGEIRVEPTKISPTGYVEEITKVETQIDSLWGSPIPNVWVQGFLLDKTGTAIRNTVPSQSVEMTPWGNRTMDLFLDTHSVPPDTYDFNVVVHMEEKIISKAFPLELKTRPATEPVNAEEPETELDPNVLMISGGVILLLLLVVAALGYLVLKKK